MPKPRLFIGSSTENLDAAYAAQEALEHDAEVTVWTQGIFELSKYTLDSLVEALDTVDFGLFVLSPDDVVIMRDETKRAARDNVVFELGMFIGRLGRERSFLLVPRGADELHLPTDLLGMTPALYEAERTDGNLVAAIGPAANKVRKSLRSLGPVSRSSVEADDEPSVASTTEGLIEKPEDVLALLEAWMGQRNSAQNRGAIRYADVDKELGLKPGSTKAHIVEAATRWKYQPRRLGEEVVSFEDAPRPRRTSNW